MVRIPLAMLTSRGDTRRVEGELKGGSHGEEGEFDSSQIVMKRWAEFERDRRRKQLAAQQYELPNLFRWSDDRDHDLPPPRTNRLSGTMIRGTFEVYHFWICG